jgi:CRISPR-associated endoribonuclease Cas6
MEYLGRISIIFQFLEDASFRGRGGETLHGFLINEIKEVDEKFAKEIHNTRKPKPFSISPFFIIDGEGKMKDGLLHLKKGTQAEAKISALNQKMWNFIVKAFSSAEKRILKVGDAEVKIQQIRFHGGEGEFITYQTILKNSPFSRSFECQIITPLTFRQNGINIPLPLPELFFSSLLSIWNTFSPQKIPSEIKKKFSRIAISMCKLRTEIWKFSTYKIVGSKGVVRYKVEDEFDEEEIKFLNALCLFANFSGVGYKRTMGMGMVEVQNVEKTS